MPSTKKKTYNVQKEEKKEEKKKEEKKKKTQIRTTKVAP